MNATEIARPLPQGGRGLRIGIAVTTGLFSLMMGLSGLLYLAGTRSVVDTFHVLGYPDYFRQLLGVAKLAGVVALLAPGAPTLREWAYAGFTFTLIAAFASHLLSGDAPIHALAPMLALGPLMASYLLRRRRAASRG